MSDEEYEEVELDEINEDASGETDWQAEAAKYKAIADRRKAKLDKLVKAPVVEPPKPVESQAVPAYEDERVDLRLDGYSKTEVELIMRNGGSSILKDPNNPVVIGLQAVREQRKAEQAAEQATDHSGLSEVERKYTPEQLSNMSSEELKKVLPHA